MNNRHYLRQIIIQKNSDADPADELGDVAPKEGTLLSNFLRKGGPTFTPS